MLEVMLAVRPKWMRLIFRGMKSTELRLSKPNTAEPFLVDLYETKSDSGRGAVVGQCLCYLAARVTNPSEMTALQGSSCVTAADMRKYSAQRHISAWYLAEVKKFKEPRQLSEYGIAHAPQSWCYVKEGNENAGENDAKRISASVPRCG